MHRKNNPISKNNAIAKGDKNSFGEIERGKKVAEGKCPLIKKPLENCYCNSLRSNHVVKVIYNCASHFKECKIYQKYIGEELTPADIKRE